jgi:RND superfamily putative drug exporter
VADGLATTARVISAAAAIMVFVFGSFVLEGEPASSSCSAWAWPPPILLDATVVRMVLVPATMELLGTGQLVAAIGWLDRVAAQASNVEGPPMMMLPVDEPPSPEAPPQDRTPELIG